MTSCNCERSFGAVCAILAAIGAALLLAGEACTAAGGRLSDSAWICTSEGGVVTLLWRFVTPGSALLAILAGVAAYFVAATLVRRRGSRA